MLFGHYTFSNILLDPALLPPYKGSTFRGAFGMALKRVVCAVKNKQCDACMLFSRCVYARVFENCAVDAPSARMASAPHPYVIEPALETKARYAEGDSFNFGLLLFGEFNELLPYFIYAFEVMGESGIGKQIKDRQRSRFRLDSVTVDKTAIYDPQEKKIRKTVAASEVLLEAPPETSQEIELIISFKTPLRLKFENHLKADLPFHLLVRAMLRRISSLFNTFGNGEPKLDYRGLIARASDVKTVASTLRWFDWERYSSRQDQAMLMGGIVGSVTYRGKLAEFLPLIALTEKFHIGKQTSFGLGHFQQSWKVLP